MSLIRRQIRASTICSGSPHRFVIARNSSTIPHCFLSVSGAQIATLRPSTAQVSMAGSPSLRAISTASAVKANRRDLLRSPSTPSGPAARRGASAPAPRCPVGAALDGLLKQREQMRIASASPTRTVRRIRAPPARGARAVRGGERRRSPQERSLCGRVVSGARLHVAERQQQIAELGVVGAREALEILQSKAIEASGLLVGQASRR